MEPGRLMRNCGNEGEVAELGQSADQLATAPLLPRARLAKRIRDLGLVLFAAMLYAWIIALMKKAVAVEDPSIVFVVRYLFAVLALGPLYFAHQRPPIRTPRVWWHVLRGAIGFVMFLMYTMALERIPLQNAMVLNSSYILFVPLLLLLFLRRRPAPGAFVGLAVGFAGIVVVSGFHAHASIGVGSLLALGSAVAAASATVLVAWLRRTDSSYTVLFYFFNTSLLLSLVWAVANGKPLSVHHWGILVAIGGLTAVYQQLLTHSLKHLSSVVVSSAMTSSVIFGFVLNAALFHRTASQRDYAGSTLILSGVLTTLWAGCRGTAEGMEMGEMPAEELLSESQAQ